jgi:hypothetical protein
MAYVKSHPADRFIFWNIRLFHQLQFQCLIIERDSNDNTRWRPCAYHKMVFHHIDERNCVQTKVMCSGNQVVRSKLDTDAKSRAATILLDPSRDPSRCIASNTFWDPRGWRGKYLATLEAEEKRRVRVLPQHVCSDSSMTLELAGQAISRRRDRSALARSFPHKRLRAGMPYRSALNLSAPPDVPASNTAIVNRVSAVG